MSFYERYAQICANLGIDPCSQRTAELIGTTRASISIWNTKGTAPKSDTVAAIANALNVSTDYLLGRTDDPTDWANPATQARLSKQSSVDQDVKTIAQAIMKLDDVDRIKIEAYIDGLLSADKYLPKKQA